MIQIWKSDTPAQRILEWVCWFCRGDRQLRRQWSEGQAEIERLQRYVVERDHYRRQWSEGQAEIERLRAELAAERERCAKVAETFITGGDVVGRAIAAAIRERE